MKEDLVDIFSRRTDSNTFDHRDFLSYYEKGIILNRNKRNGKKLVVMHRGVSVDIIINEDKLVEFYKTSIRIKQRFKQKYFWKIKFLMNAGLIWDTSNNFNEYHRTFLKSDEFNLDMVVKLSCHRIDENV